MKYKGLVGVVLAAMTLLSLAPGASAMAETGDGQSTVPVSIPTDATESIKIRGRQTALEGHSFKAVRIGTYTDAQATAAPDNKLVAVSVGTDPAVKSAATKVLSGMDKVDADYQGNPIGQVASKWLGYSTPDDGNNEDTVSNDSVHTWGGANGSQKNSGKLRDFVQKLDAEPEFQKLVDATVSQTQPLVNDPADAPSDAVSPNDYYAITLSGLKAGLYVVIDSTATAPNAASLDAGSGQTTRRGSTNAIDMVVGTPVGSYDTMQGDTTPKLGVVDMKNTDASISVSWQDVHHNGTAATTDKPRYAVSSTIPMTTGFNHYRYIIAVTLSAGQTYDDASAGLSVRIGSRPVRAVTDANPNGTYVYSQAPTADGGTEMVFDFSNRIMQYQSTGNVNIAFRTSLANAGSGLVTTDVALQYSNDPQCQPQSGCHEDDGSFGTLSQRLSIAIQGMAMQSRTRTVNGSVPSVAGFTLTRDADSKPLTFVKVADGTYKAADEKAQHPVREVVSASGDDIKSGGLSKGNLNVSGLCGGTYTIRQVSADGRNGLAGKIMPSFKVTIASKRLAGGVASSDDVVYTNTTDAWHVVSANSFSNGVLPVIDVSSVFELPFDGAAGWLVLGAAVALVILALLVLGLMKRHDREPYM